MKIGMPRGLLYFHYGALWETFLTELGLEVVTSPPTNKRILDLGVKNCVDDACLPVKLFHGHVEFLKGKVDYIFIPRIVSIKQWEYICPKFCGLPEMVKNTIKDMPKMLLLEHNLHKPRSNFIKGFYQLGASLGFNMKQIKNSYRKAVQSQSTFEEQCKMGVIPWYFNKASLKVSKNREHTITIALIGHPYVLYDHYANMNIISKLQQRGIRVITPEMVLEREIDKHAGMLSKPMFWSFGRKLYGASMYYVKDFSVDGVIYLSAFACGIDSLIAELVERKIRRETNIPIALFNIDEHTGEAGMNTRLDAFIDMVIRRKEHENNLSTHGKYIYSC